MLGSITRACARAGLRPADLVPAALEQLARRLRGQPQGRRHHPARLRRLPRVSGAARTAGRAGHAFRALGRGAAGPAGRLDRLRQFPRRPRGRRRTCSSSAAGSIAFLGDASDHYPEFLERYRGYAQALARRRVARWIRQLQVDADHARSNPATTPLRSCCARGVPFDAIVRRQRPDRDRRDARAARARPARARRRRGRRLRRHSRPRASRIRR